MQIKPQQLAGKLQEDVLPVYLFCGDEPQQLGELADLLRTAAKNRGFTAREIFFADKQFDWQLLSAATENLSLFADQKIIDLKLAGAPGVGGGKALAAFCQKPPEDTLLLITTGKIGKDSQKSNWFQAIDRVGCIIQVWPLAGQDFLNWIRERLHRKGMVPEPDAVTLLANRVEGNLLAAAQEIEKLYVLYGAGQLSSQQIIDVVADNSRFDVFKLVESILAAHLDKILKILASLKDEGVASAVVLWALLRETRILVRIKTCSSPQERENFLRSQGVWGGHKVSVENASKKLSFKTLNAVLTLGAKADRQIKGQQQGDAWETLLAASLILAGVSVLDKTT